MNDKCLNVKFVIPSCIHLLTDKTCEKFEKEIWDFKYNNYFYLENNSLHGLCRKQKST